MADMFEGMLRGAIEVFRSGDRHRAADISRTERIMDRLGAAIRRYLADIGNEQPLDDEDEGARGQEILSAVINLEHAADIIANNLLEFAAKRTRRARRLCPRGARSDRRDARRARREPAARADGIPARRCGAAGCTPAGGAQSGNCAAKRRKRRL